ncbi:hypothetical protein [Bradyrhizobium jicamae]|uniref:hypothetical protein n=1 Tax=Bradyrhizobium jicamae TaxID=280332 RepID=UPI0012ED89AA|nr:hypothetical protein [Bradyrhizobium jicamae]
MSTATLRDENERLKALLARTQAALSEHQAALAMSEEAGRRRAFPYCEAFSFRTADCGKKTFILIGLREAATQRYPPHFPAWHMIGA